MHSQMLQSSPIMQKTSSNYYQDASNYEFFNNPKIDLKSNRAKRKAVSKTLTKLSSINSKINENKK